MPAAVAVAAIAVFVSASALAQPPGEARSIEAREGWVRLFDGKTLYGWTPEGGANWRVDDGVLRAGSGLPGWLRSTMPFSDFMLHLEFRAPTAFTHSAVFFRAARQGNPGQTGFEVTLQDDGPGYLTGSIARFKAAPRLLSASGSWKTLDVVARGAEIMVSVNGNRTAAIKSYHAKLGYFGLYYYPGNPVEFRNIRVKPLDFSCITNGRDYAGFRPVKPVGAPERITTWSILDGAIHGEGGPGEIETEQAWSDLILQVDVRALRGISGAEPRGALFFRGLRNGWHSGYTVALRNEIAPELGLAGATGALPGLEPARRLVGSSGSWQTITVLAVGRDLATWVNGEITAVYRDQRPSSPNNPVNTARLLRGTAGLLIDTPDSSYDLRNFCVKRMER